MCLNWCITRERVVSEKVSLGIIGLGTIAQTQHLPNIAELSEKFDVGAVADISSGLVAVIADRLPGSVATSLDWRDTCSDPHVDAVVLLTPGAHGDMAEEALLAGKHVFAEKPLCLTVAMATRLASIARDRGLVLQIGYMKLHEQRLDELRRSLPAIGSGRLVRHTVYHPETETQLAHTNIDRFDDADSDVLEAALASEKRHTFEALGDIPSVWGRLYTDVLHGSVVHSVSLVRGVMGGLPTIADAVLWPASALSTGDEPPSLSVAGSLADGTRVEFSWLWLPDYPTYREVLEIHGTRGSIELLLPPPYLQQQAAELTVRLGDGLVHHDGGAESAFFRELDAFHTAISKTQVLDDADGTAEDVAFLQDFLGVLAAQVGVSVGGEAGARR
jgi:predicted dehydrogenase